MRKTLTRPIVQLLVVLAGLFALAPSVTSAASDENPAQAVIREVAPVAPP